MSTPLHTQFNYLTQPVCPFKETFIYICREYWQCPLHLSKICLRKHELDILVFISLNCLFSFAYSLRKWFAAHVLLIRSNGEIVWIKHFSSQGNDSTVVNWAYGGSLKNTRISPFEKLFNYKESINISFLIPPELINLEWDIQNPDWLINLEIKNKKRTSLI